jgi:hypothetical protein
VLWLAPGWGPRWLDVAFNSDALCPLPGHQEHVDMLRVFTWACRRKDKPRVIRVRPPDGVRTIVEAKHVDMLRWHISAKPPRRGRNRFCQRDLARVMRVAKPGDRVEIDPVSGRIVVTIAKPGGEPAADTTDANPWDEVLSTNAAHPKRPS